MPDAEKDQSQVVVEYAIRWAEPLSGFSAISTPHESRPMVEMALEGSAFDGEIVHRTVTRTPWEADTYLCPTSGEVESRTRGGFDVCCDDPTCPSNSPGQVVS